MITRTNNGIILKSLNDRKASFNVFPVDKEWCNLENETGLRLTVRRQRLADIAVKESTRVICLTDREISKLHHDAYVKLKDSLMKRTIELFPKIFRHRHLMLTESKKFIQEVPGLILWGHSIGGYGGVCLGGIIEAWESNDLTVFGHEGNKKYILSVQQGLSGYRHGYVYDPHNSMIEKLTSPFLDNKHFYKLTEIRNHYYRYYHPNPLLTLESFLNTIN